MISVKSKPRQQKQNPSKCDICDKDFKSTDGLRAHFNGVHNVIKEHQCNICQKVIRFQCQLISHVKTTAHENIKIY